MSRSEAHYGLNERAEKIVKGEEILAYYKKEVRLYPNNEDFYVKDSGVYSPVYANSVTTEKSGKKYGGVYDPETDLMAYVFPNGDTYTEFLQETIWSSGPCFFLALKDEKGNVIKESLWTKKELGETLGFEIK